jgi:hypothetical protein
MKFPALREMHQPLAAGKTIAADVAEDGCTYITAKVVDPVAIKKVKEGVYAGFSIGGTSPRAGAPRTTRRSSSRSSWSRSAWSTGRRTRRRCSRW